MKPVVLVKLPNTAQFLGTFDIQNYEKWWKSEPLPGDVEAILSNEWCYGSYHLATTKQTDSSYSIYRSSDYGKTWDEVLNLHEEIYCLTRIDYGWMLLNTSGGWYESTNTGLDWVKISTGAPGCKTVINIEENVLLGHSGNYVYRSDDVGHTWSQVLDCHFLKYHPAHYPNVWVQTPNPADCYPALAGVNNRVLVGAGPYLLWSDDTGKEWSLPWANNGYGWNTNEGSSGNKHPDGRGLQLVYTGGHGPLPEQNMFMVRFYIPKESIVRNYFSGDGGHHWLAKFDQPFSGYTNGALSSYETMVYGTDKTTILVYSSQMQRNPVTSKDNPSPKYSIDGGNTWVDLQPDQFKVYEGDPDTSETFDYGGSFIEEDFTHTIWLGEPCHNRGRYVSDGFYVRGISVDYNLGIHKPLEIEWYMDATVRFPVKEICTELDISLCLSLEEFEMSDMRLQRVNEKIWSMSNVTKATIDKSMPVNTAIAYRKTYPVPLNALLMHIQDIRAWHNVLVKGPVESDYGMDIILVSEHDWGHNFEKYMPQYPWMDWPPINYDVFDSRKTPLL